MPHTLSRRLFLASMGILALPRLSLANEMRLVTVGAPVTEIVFALGSGGKVAATDITSTFPAEAKSLPKVGYMRTLSAEGLLSLTPTHVLAQDGSGPAHVFERLKAMGVGVDILPEEASVEGVGRKIRKIAGVIGRSGEGEALIERLSARFSEVTVKDGAGGLGGKATLCLIHAGPGGLLAAGTGTVADTLIHLAGGRNVLAEIRDYRPLSVEAAIAAAPEILIVTRRMVEQTGGADAVLALPEIAQTPVAATRRLAVIDDTLLLGMGPRTPDAVQAVASAGG